VFKELQEIVFLDSQPLLGNALEFIRVKCQVVPYRGKQLDQDHLSEESTWALP